jgi:hypothetical protein
MDPTEVAKDRILKGLAGEYADLLSIRQDLQFVAEAARRYQHLADGDDPDGVMRRAFWWSAVVAYRRSFTSGRGHGLIKRTRLMVPEPVVEALSAASKETHERTLRAADQHVAHRVDEKLSQMPISLLFHNDASGAAVPAVAGLAQLGALYVGPVPKEAGELAELADHLVRELEAALDAKRSELLSRASELLEKRQQKGPVT